MATPDMQDYLKALMGIESGAAEDSPFTGLQSAADQGNKFLAQNASHTSLPHALVGGIVTGLLGGLADRGQRSYQDNQNEQIQGALDNWRQGKTFDRGSMSASVFNRLRDFTQAQGLADATRNTQEESDLTRAIKLKASPTASETLLAAPDMQVTIEALRNHIANPEKYPGLTPEQQHSIATAPLQVQHLVQEMEQQAAVGQRAGNVSEKSALDITGPLAIGADINKGLAALDSVYKTDPSLVNKAWNQLPTGSDAYNIFKGLQIDGARVAKALEGRVNDTTLGLYTDLLTSLSTEPLGAVKKRASAFVQSLRDDSLARANMLHTASGKDISGMLKTIDALIPPEATATGGGQTYSESELQKAGYTASDIAALKTQGKVK